MKKIVIVSGFLIALVAVVFVRCSNDNGFGFGGGNTGVGNVFVTDVNGHPLNGGTVFIPASSFTFMTGQASALAALAGGCPDPGVALGTDGNGDSTYDCTDSDGFANVPCNGLNGNFTAGILDAAGNNVTPTGFTVNCGGATSVTLTVAQQTPTPSPSP